MTPLTPDELADQQPRRQDEKPCSNPACPLVCGHRGPCAPKVMTPVERATRAAAHRAGVGFAALDAPTQALHRDVMKAGLVAALNVYEIAHDLHTLHAQPDDGGACADCDFRAGYLIGRLMRDHP